MTKSNLPTGQCAVCLYGFREGDEFTKTECYHHFHSHCLASHVAAADRYYREEQEKLPQWQQDSSKQFQVIFSLSIRYILYDSFFFLILEKYLFQRLSAPCVVNQ